MGTPDYLSPEALNGDPIGLEADWWSLGAVLFELMTGKHKLRIFFLFEKQYFVGYPPFTADSVNEIFQNLMEGKIQWPTDAASLSPEAVDLISKLLCSDPHHRLGHRGSFEIKTHAFFSGIDWSRLREDDPAFVPMLGSFPSTKLQDLVLGCPATQMFLTLRRKLSLKLRSQKTGISRNHHQRKVHSTMKLRR